jgi:hypothetical protein
MLTALVCWEHLPSSNDNTMMIFTGNSTGPTRRSAERKALTVTETSPGSGFRNGSGNNLPKGSASMRTHRAKGIPDQSVNAVNIAANKGGPGHTFRLATFDEITSLLFGHCVVVMTTSSSSQNSLVYAMYAK